MKKLYRRSISGLLALPAKWQNPIPLASPAVGMLILITAALGVMMSCII